MLYSGCLNTETGERDGMLALSGAEEEILVNQSGEKTHALRSGTVVARQTNISTLGCRRNVVCVCM